MFLTMEYIDGEDLAALLRASAASRRSKGHRDRAPDLRRPGRGARQRRAAPRPQAGQRHDRRPRPGPHHRLRPGRPRRHVRPTCAPGRRPTWRPSSSPARTSRSRATSSRSASCSTRSSPASARSTPTRSRELLRQHDDASAVKPAVRARARSGGRAGRSSAASSTTRRRGRRSRDRGVGGTARRRSAGRGAGRGRDAVAGDGRRRRPGRAGAAGDRPVAAGVRGGVPRRLHRPAQRGLVPSPRADAAVVGGARGSGAAGARPVRLSRRPGGLGR